MVVPFYVVIAVAGARDRYRQSLQSPSQDCVIEPTRPLYCNPIEPIPLNDWRLGKTGDNSGWQPEHSVMYKSKKIGTGHTSYVYIDAGANTYSSSIGNWFKNIYPNSEKFKIVAFEAETKYDSTYKNKDVELIHNAVWTKNTTISWHTKYVDPSAKRGMRKVKTIDFADFLQRRFKESDFVTIKMDIEGAEYEVIPDLLNKNVTHLIDEFFVEVHTDINTCCKHRTDRKYSDARKLIKLLRKHGIYAHIWG